MSDIIRLVQGDTYPIIFITLRCEETDELVDLSPNYISVYVRFRRAGTDTMLYHIGCKKVDGGVKGKVMFDFVDRGFIPAPVITSAPAPISQFVVYADPNFFDSKEIIVQGATPDTSLQFAMNGVLSIWIDISESWVIRNADRAIIGFVMSLELLKDLEANTFISIRQVDEDGNPVDREQLLEIPPFFAPHPIPLHIFFADMSDLSHNGKVKIRYMTQGAILEYYDPVMDWRIVPQDWLHKDGDGKIDSFAFPIGYYKDVRIRQVNKDGDVIGDTYYFGEKVHLGTIGLSLFEDTGVKGDANTTNGRIDVSGFIKDMVLEYETSLMEWTIIPNSWLHRDADGKVDYFTLPEGYYEEFAVRMAGKDGNIITGKVTIRNKSFLVGHNFYAYADKDFATNRRVITKNIYPELRLKYFIPLELPNNYVLVPNSWLHRDADGKIDYITLPNTVGNRIDLCLYTYIPNGITSYDRVGSQLKLNLPSKSSSKGSSANSPANTLTYNAPPTPPASVASPAPALPSNTFIPPVFPSILTGIEPGAYEGEVVVDTQGLGTQTVYQIIRFRVRGNLK